jgi:NADH:ubiquinone oxidoreductase subunit 2 (subunit N)
MSSEGLKSLENSIKYFLVQRVASATFLLSCLFRYFSSLDHFEFFIIGAIFLKLGAAPLHRWFISLVKTVRPWVLFFLSTIQKVIPLVILCSINTWVFFLFSVILLNSSLIFWNRVRTIRLIKILALSSVNNLRWILIGSFIGLRVTIFYIFIYIIVILGVILVFKGPQKVTFRQIHSIGYYDQLIAILVLLSLGGLPPLTGFLGKIFILKFRVIQIRIALIIILIFSSLLLLFIYTSYCYLGLCNIPKILNMSNQMVSPWKKILYFVRVRIFHILVIVVT